MTDKKTIMSWLEGLAEPDWRMFYSDSEVQNIAKETLTLLKEQEPKLVKIDGGSVLCPSCGNELFIYPRQKFCDECGQAVNWNDKT